MYKYKHFSLINPHLTSLYCNFSYGPQKSPEKYLCDKNCGGGGILDISPRVPPPPDPLPLHSDTQTNALTSIIIQSTSTPQNHHSSDQLRIIPTRCLPI